ncbi:MAG TPA: inositol-phosphate phosphatase [Gammaproteobacteria bacterium]|nr:inositol-phosphate phosphatase [Gammaproteobacteria bacterium]
MSKSDFLRVAIDAALAAQDVIQKYYLSNLAITIKEDLTPVTQADVETEEAIRKVISEHFPDHGFWGEELGQSNPDAEFTWLIDPIDGTKSFVRQYPLFSTQIALMQHGEIILGLSNAPIFEEMAWAERGQGAFLNDQPIHISEALPLEKATLSFGNIVSLAQQTSQWAGLSKLVARAHRTRGYVDFFHYHLLAAGKIDLVLESDVNILDIAALSLIITEAGGIFTDLEGQPITTKSTSVLAASCEALYNEAKAHLS